MILTGKIDEAKKLISSGEVSVDCEDKEGMTPLSSAAFKGLEELAKVFSINLYNYLHVLYYLHVLINLLPKCELFTFEIVSF